MKYSKNKPGFFIIFEGLDKTGKSTQIDILYNTLKNNDYNVIKTFEPGDTDTGKIIRSTVLKHKPDYSLTEEAEYFLFLADRFDHIKKVIIPALNKGYIVLCDRFHFSTYAYQVYPFFYQKNKILHDIEKKIAEYIFTKIAPDIVFYFIRKNEKYHGDINDSIERRSFDYKAMVSKGFAKSFKRYKTYIKTLHYINYENTIEVNSEKIYALVKEELLWNKKTGKYKKI